MMTSESESLSECEGHGQGLPGLSLDGDGVQQPGLSAAGCKRKHRGARLNLVDSDARPRRHRGLDGGRHSGDSENPRHYGYLPEPRPGASFPDLETKARRRAALILTKNNLKGSSLARKLKCTIKGPGPRTPTDSTNYRG